MVLYNECYAQFDIPHVYMNHNGFHTNSSTNSTQDYILSPFLMIYIVTDITISIFNISPILNIQLHYRDSCEYNCTLLKSNARYSYSLQEFVVIF